ncbi:MAG: hypothetical protein NVSMB22_22170 [Chloroflexota bacterium]
MNDKRLSATHAKQDAPIGAKHRGHGWTMMVCCIPMLVIAVALVVIGVASASFILAAVACMAMMALMMVGMNQGGHDERT